MIEPRLSKEERKKIVKGCIDSGLLPEVGRVILKGRDDMHLVIWRDEIHRRVKEIEDRLNALGEEK